MKILYLIDVDLDKTSGVATKVCMQAKQWEVEGHDIILLSVFSLIFFNLEGKRLSQPKVVRKNKGKLGFIINAYKSSILLKSLLTDVEFDVVYMRYKIYDPFFKSAVKNKPIIAEMNTVYERETRERSYASYLYYSLFKSLSFSTIEGFVCVSNEINRLTIQNRHKSIVIANGIDTSLFSIEQHNNKRAVISFIGSPNQKWHGVDKIIFLSKKLKNFDFHIIGIDGQSTNNLFFYGYCSAEEYLPILKNSDVGIGSLAMHRLGLDEASPLKSRQYLALGLPIIYAYNDTDISNNFPFALELPNNENNIQDTIEEIEKFVNKVFNNRDIRVMAQEFAKSTLNVRKKEEKRLQFMKEIFQNKE